MSKKYYLRLRLVWLASVPVVCRANELPLAVEVVAAGANAEHARGGSAALKAWKGGSKNMSLKRFFSLDRITKKLLTEGTS